MQCLGLCCHQLASIGKSPGPYLLVGWALLTSFCQDLCCPPSYGADPCPAPASCSPPSVDADPRPAPACPCRSRAARLVATERGDEGPLQPLHIHAAYQRLKDKGRMPSRGGGVRRRPFV